MSNKELPKTYNPAEHEAAIYEKWEKSGFFCPDSLKGEPYSIMMPPPNVTGVLHLGHALENSLMDIMARYQRMNGKKVLLLPGTDHAAVATQAKVEKVLIESGIKNPRRELGREKLLEKIREYAENSKSTILKQIKKMGTSCDWSRLAYTFDAERNLAVNTVFTKMYNDGLIYRGRRIVNWDSKLQTTISDDEIVWQEEKAPFYYLQYGPFVIATARPETKFGDKYVVMHPDDKRYKKYKHGEKFDCEWINGKVTATIIKDKAIDSSFGTGVMTITPWHSMVDFEIAERHNLKGEQVIDFNGKLLPVAGEFAGLGILEARPKIVEKLKAKGLVVKVEENYLHRVSKGDRSNSLVEPQIKEQWFVAVNKKIPGKDKSLKDLMREAVTTGHNGDKEQKVKITPERFEKTYLHWINNLRDWCISRQIWWGHRIPVYYREQENKKARKPSSAEASAGRQESKIEITYFVHGTTTDNEKGKRTGWNPGVLSALGKKQNLALKQTLKERGDKYDAVFTSDLKRAAETARTVFKGVKIIVDKRLRECNYGDLNGQPETKFKTEKHYIKNQFPNGESYEDVEKRVREFLMEILEKYAGKKIAIVSHMYPQLALGVILKKQTWIEAIDEDWRKKWAWQAGWKYEIMGQENQKTEKQVFFVRHGQSEHNEKKIYGGQQDHQLTDKGRSDAEEVGKKLAGKGIQKILCSDLGRTKETADIINKYLKVKIECISELREAYAGEVEGKPIINEKPIIAAMFDKKTGETEAELIERAKRAWNIIHSQKEEKILVVGHQTFNSVLFAVSENNYDLCSYRKKWKQHHADIFEKTIFVLPEQKKLGFHPRIVPELLSGKSRTYRIHDHNLTVGDRVAMEDSGSGSLLGYAVITGVKKLTIGEIALPDMIHSGKYKTTDELIQAFKRMHPEEKNITKKTPVFIYDYNFSPIAEGDKEIYVGAEEPTNPNFIFLHGFYRTREVKDPLNWLNKQLPNQNNFWQILPNPDKPNRDEQKKYVLKNAKIIKNSIVVTHSLGSALALEIIQSENIKIKKLVMLAPSLGTPTEELKEYKNFKVDFEKIKKNIGEIIIFQASKDRAGKTEEIAEMAGLLDAKIIKVENSAPHFNSDESREVLDELKKYFWIQDEDTLDTWFSSGLWTFSTLGWPKTSPNPSFVRRGTNAPLKGDKDDLETFHPTSWMQMGYEILFFWMARMILMSTYTLDQIPFKDVYIHGMLRSESGQKFSKSSGNNIDPLEVIAKFGTDALRLSVISGIAPGNDSKFYEEKVEGARNMVNKLWNVARYIITNYELRITNEKIKTENLIDTISDDWIITNFNSMSAGVKEDLENYRFSQAIEGLSEFTYDYLADWYLEVCKFEKTDKKKEILNYLLINLLKLWHPFIPFVTEAIWQEIGNKKLLMVEEWPKDGLYKAEENIDKNLGKPLFQSGNFDLIKEIIVAIRNARAENKVEPARKVKAVIYAGDKKELVESQAHLIKGLRTGISELEIKEDKPPLSPLYKGGNSAIYSAAGGVEIYLLGAVDSEKEKGRLEKEIANLEKIIGSAEIRLGNKEFVDKAPEAIVKKEKDKLAGWRTELEKFKEQMKNLK